jgi:RNA polymerase sigma factor (sigma-70 family)
VRSSIRGRPTYGRRFAPWHEPAEPGSEDALILADEHVEILRLVRRLPRRQREVLVLRYWSGLTEAEIASTLGISPGTVKSTASRAVATLKRHLEAGG